MAAVPSIGRATGVELPEAADAAAHDLYVRNYPRILRFCRSRLRSREDAEDAAQTTFAYAVGALRRGVVPTLESAWLLKIARNVCLNRWAARGRRSAVEIARDPQLLEELAEGHESTGGEAHALYEALQRLTEQQRRAIVLREWQGLSYAEIAEELELSQSAVETLIFRARRALARELRRDDRLRSRSGFGSLLAGLKSLLGGGGAAVKVAAGIAALATAGGIAAPRIEHRLQHHQPPAVSTPKVDAAPSAARNGVLDNPARISAAPKARRLVSSPITADAPTRGDLPQRDAPSGNAPAAPGADGGATSPPSGVAPTKPDDPSQPAPSSPAPGATDPPVTLPAPTLPPPPALPPAPTIPPAPALPPPPDLPAAPPAPAPALPPTPPLPPVNAPDLPLPGGVNLP